MTFPCDACGEPAPAALWEESEFPRCPSCGWPMDRSSEMPVANGGGVAPVKTRTPVGLTGVGKSSEGSRVAPSNA